MNQLLVAGNDRPCFSRKNRGTEQPGNKTAGNYAASQYLDHEHSAKVQPLTELAGR